jgi:hypothetical protein
MKNAALRIALLALAFGLFAAGDAKAQINLLASAVSINRAGVLSPTFPASPTFSKTAFLPTPSAVSAPPSLTRQATRSLPCPTAVPMR